MKKAALMENRVLHYRAKKKLATTPQHFQLIENPSSGVF
jgi:hypothetical protein